MRSRQRVWVAVYLASLILISLCLACGGGLSSKGPGGKGGPTVSVPMEVELHQAWRENDAAGDAKYLGRTVEVNLVRGKITKNGSTYTVAGEVAPPRVGVLFHFKSSENSKLAEAGSNAAFKVRGVCRGKRANPSAWKGYVIDVDDCVIIDILEYKDGEWQSTNKNLQRSDS